MRSIRALHALCFLLMAWASMAAHAAADGTAPLLQPGRQTLYQRVLAAQDCVLQDTAGGSGAAGDSDSIRILPPLSRHYAYARQRAADGSDWLQVGPDAHGQRSGWIPAVCAVEWNTQLTLALTSPARRDPLLFFEHREQLEDLLLQPDRGARLDTLQAQLQRTGQADGVLAREPSVAIDPQRRFYLLPVLSGEEIMTPDGQVVRLLEVASLNASRAAGPATDRSLAMTDATASAAGTLRTAVVFVIDTTISMRPYIDQTRDMIRQVYARMRAQGQTQDVRFGMVAYRSNVAAVPGLEYTSRIYVDPSQASDEATFMAQVADIRQATVSSSRFDEDAYAGVMQAIDGIDWSGFDARYIVLVTDAGALDAADALSSTGLDAAQVRQAAADAGIAIFALHLRTPAGRRNHARAEQQYRVLAQHAAADAPLYYPIDAGNVRTFGRRIGALTETLVERVGGRAGTDGQEVALAGIARPDQKRSDTDDADQQIRHDAAQVGHAMQLSWLGGRSAASVPTVLRGWISDHDLRRPDVPATEARVLLTKAQLSDLSDAVRQALEAVESGFGSEQDMFARLRSVAASMGTNPDEAARRDDLSGDVSPGMRVGEYLDSLPYRSAIMSLDEEAWRSWDRQAQAAFIDGLKARLRLYERYNEDVDRWISLAHDGDVRDDVYPVPLEMMP